MYICYYKYAVVTLLNNVFTTNKQLHVVLVPSLKDAHHPFVYPQPPFQRKKVLEALDLEDKERLHLFSNPCTFSINGILFGISSIDVIMHLSSNEVYRQQKKDPNVHRLLRLSEQLIDQKSFYPIFPPPPSPAAAAASTQQQFESSVPMDLKYLKQIHFECTPDVLICPSMLNRFCGVRT
jgi:DNA polymerase alpha subunit B